MTPATWGRIPGVMFLDTPGGFWTNDIHRRRYPTWQQRHTLLLTSLTTLASGTLGEDIPMDVAWGAPGEGITFHFGINPKGVLRRERVR